MQKCRKFLENVLKSRKQRLVALRKGKIFKLLRYFVHFIIIFHFLFVFCHFLAISHFVPCDMGPFIGSEEAIPTSSGVIFDSTMSMSSCTSLQCHDL